MNTTLTTKELDTRVKLSSLWVFIFLNMIFRDLHELGSPGFLQEMMTGVVNGVQITDGLMLIGGLMIAIPLLMVPLIQFLKVRVNRLANIWIGGLMIPNIIFTYSPPDLDDIFFMVIEIAALFLIILFAWRWSDRSQPTGATTSILEGMK